MLSNIKSYDSNIYQHFLSLQVPWEEQDNMWKLDVAIWEAQG